MKNENNDLDRGIPVGTTQSRGHSSDVRNKSLLDAGNNILNTSASTVNPDIRKMQSRIDRLVKERQKVDQEMNKFPDLDELDVLQTEVEKGYNTDENRYVNGVQKYSDNIRGNKNLNFNEKARNLGNIRQALENPYQQNPNNNAGSYRHAKGMYENRLNKLDNIIRDKRNEKNNSERRKILENMRIKVPEFKQKPDSSLRNIEARQHQPKSMMERYSRHSTKRPKLSRGYENKPDQKQVNKSFTPSENGRNKLELKNKAGSDVSMFLPDVGRFKQNEYRADDLEVEERALMNMYAQDFDDMKLLELVKQNPEVYKHKFQQYKEKCQNRLKIEKQLQSQRLDKIRRDFGKDAYEEERKINEERWVDEQNRFIIAQRLKERLAQPKTPEYVPQKPKPEPRSYPKPQYGRIEYDSNVGVGIHMDYVSNLEAK
jgi:hypothetical protein